MSSETKDNAIELINDWLAENGYKPRDPIYSNEDKVWIAVAGKPVYFPTELADLWKVLN